MAATEPDQSLTLDVDALTRGADALSHAIEHGHPGHYCAEWIEDGQCAICWEIAAEVLRAAEGLRKCGNCNGGAIVAPGGCCPSCGGNGLESLPDA